MKNVLKIILFTSVISCNDQTPRSSISNISTDEISDDNNTDEIDRDLLLENIQLSGDKKSQIRQLQQLIMKRSSDLSFLT